MNGFAILFRFPVGDPDAGVMYAGRTRDGALGFAETLATALIWSEPVVAMRFLENGYGPNVRAIGTVVQVTNGEVVS